ncbi:MAG: LTA synthase family protein [Oscillospiraceae bacterium]|nr:LTA synthase family protein [Oscillospiraceae bacterium]
MTKKRKIAAVLAGVFLFVSMLVMFSAFWALRVFKSLTLDEIIFHLRMPLKGTNTDMVGDYLLTGLLPALLICAAGVAVVVTAGKRNRAFPAAVASVLALGLVSDGVSMAKLDEKLGVIEYATASESDFIEDNYVDPKDVSIVFPEKKRNLIYIYLESTEVTFADKAEGGAFEENLIPHLTDIALENECFNGDTGALNGGISYPCTTWTMGAMVAQTSGLPLKIPVYNNYMDTQESFYADVTALGNILEDNGYKNVLMVGSDVVFGGRKMYFSSHGDYEFFDFVRALDEGRVAEKVFWGYEDKKLMEFAKEELLTLAEEDKPFNFTMLTVDTHFEDGYVCEDCPHTYEDQYSNVYACSDARIGEFLSWIKQQDFYENTTVILMGDHPTMDSDFCEGIDGDYTRRVYTAYVNSAKEYTGGRREYSTFDAFPTTLSALGAHIEGDRLGLGTDLYSDTLTITERYGAEYCTAEIEKRSEFTDSLNTFSISPELIERLEREHGVEVTETPDGLKVIYALRFDISHLPGFGYLEAELSHGGEKAYLILDHLDKETLNYSSTKTAMPGVAREDVTVTVYLVQNDGTRSAIGTRDFSEEETAVT